MDRKELEDCMHALGQVYAFYGKEFDDIQRAFWMQFVQKQNYHKLMAALREYPEHGRYAPKPKDITEIIESNRGQIGYFNTAEELGGPKEPETDCPPEIARAWMFWLQHWYGMNPSTWPKVEGVTTEESEAMLLLVNQEAARTSMPEAIPDGYKIPEVWGGVTH